MIDVLTPELGIIKEIDRLTSYFLTLQPQFDELLKTWLWFVSNVISDNEQIAKDIVS